ncbi:MAG: hypothetical protein AVO38_13790 [delta proteobacterium ML8_D]|jgi:hypothetical protein|nr:MAG: hypothetical protein AVO38_13790 [delta proteobacterium ML8_D]
MNSTVVNSGSRAIYEQDNLSLCRILKVRPHTGYIPLLHQKIQPVPAKNYSILRRKPGITFLTLCQIKT